MTGRVPSRWNRMLRWLWPWPPEEPRPLPGRPPAGVGPGSKEPGGTEPLRPVRAVCCSGGGIRSAAFSLGGLQELARRRGDGSGNSSGNGSGEDRAWYEGVDLVTAVSGGSYIAASHAIVSHQMARSGIQSPPPYAPGSPEDVRLRTHTRYLVEDPQAAALGVLSIIYGLVLNLVPILAVLYVSAKLLGLGLREGHVLLPDPHHPGGWELNLDLGLRVAGGLAATGLAVFGYDRLADTFRRSTRPVLTHAVRIWTLRLFAAALALALLLCLVPLAVYLLSGPLGSVRRVDQINWINQTVAAGSLVTTMVVLVKATLGRFRAVLQTATRTRPSRAAAALGTAGRAVAPWLGSVAAVLLLTLAFLVWTAKAAEVKGYPAGQVWGFVVALLAIPLWQLVTDVNRNSAHPFYRERLCSAYVVRREGREGAAQMPYQQPIRFSDYDRDRPQLVVCAAVNTDQPGVVPANRRCAPFTFSPRFTGVASGTMFTGEPEPVHRPGTGNNSGKSARPLPGMLPTWEYEQRAGVRLLTLPAAVAVSGAAVSPVMGRVTRTPLRLLLGLANVRLGLWLPNPNSPGNTFHPDHTAPCPETPTAGQRLRRGLRMLRWQWKQPGIRALLAETLGMTRLDRRWIYVTDGGHYENLGLVEALRRGATEIMVFDASGDPPESWRSFGQAVATARADLGVEIELDPRQMRSSGDPMRAPTLAVHGTFRYPNGVRGDLWLCVLGLPREVSWDVEAWAGTNSAFPHDSTAQQLYGDREFEAYRRLGETAARMALDLRDQKLAEKIAESSRE